MADARKLGARPTARRAMLAKVHIARKELRLDDEAYGDVLQRVTGLDSARTLTDPQLDLVLREFKRLGWKGPAGTGARSQKPNVRMIHGIWKDLRPYLTDPSPEALRAFVGRQTRSVLHPEGVAAPEFLDGRQANLVLEGLKAWLARVRRERAHAEAAAAAAEGAQP